MLQSSAIVSFSAYSYIFLISFDHHDLAPVLIYNCCCQFSLVLKSCLYDGQCFPLHFAPIILRLATAGIEKSQPTLELIAVSGFAEGSNP